MVLEYLIWQRQQKPQMYVGMALVSLHKCWKILRQQFLMVVISKMAHEVDLGLAERQIRQSLNSRMLHQEDASIE